MADILYTYKNQVYANITNRCDCSCEFCIRTHRDSVGEADNLWLEKDPTLDEIKAVMDNFDFISKLLDGRIVLEKKEEITQDLFIIPVYKVKISFLNLKTT